MKKMSDWTAYIEKTKNKHPRPLLVQAVKSIGSRSCALDIGAGALNDSKYLLKAGFQKVIALDIEEVPEVSQGFDKNIFSFQKSSIEDYVFPVDSLDLVNAQFALPFVCKNEIDRVMGAIKKSLRPQGIFVGQFFGPRDEWSDHEDVCVYTEEEVRKFLDGLDTVFFNEEEIDRKTLLGLAKHWHIFHFIAKLK